MDSWLPAVPLPLLTRCALISPSAARPRRLLAVLLFGIVLPALAPAQADTLPSDCGDLTNTYGPFDYTNPDHFRNKLPVVEKFHFSQEQELSTYKPGSKMKVDFGYTLRAFPNHHRALMALTRWLKLHKPEDWKGELRAECYFHRAIAWRPRDAVARMIFGLYLHQNQRLAEAEQQYHTALKIQPDYAEGHYNLGLLYTDQKRWPEALKAAHRAYALNYPLPGLKKRLIAAKAWQEPVAASPSAPATEPAAAAETPVPATTSAPANPPAPESRSTPENTTEPASQPHPIPTPPTPTSDDPTPGTPP